jgi:alkylated DNA repair dioxygenase AlkB
VEPFDLGIDRRAAAERMLLGDGTSWVDLVRGFVRQPIELFETVRTTVVWEQREVLRYDHYVPEKRLGGWIPPGAAPAAVRQAGLHLEATYRAPFAGVTAILYRDGNDHQGLHSDREMKWLDDTLIGIVVLGVRRPFVLRERGVDANHKDLTKAGEAAGDVVLMPGEGDLLVMGGRNQRDWLHAVPAATTDEPRVSLTWRWTSRRGRPDTNPGYFDGRQFSDRPAQPGSRPSGGGFNRGTQGRAR